MAEICLNINSLEDYDKRVTQQQKYQLEGPQVSHGFVSLNHENLQGWNFHTLLNVVFRC